MQLRPARPDESAQLSELALASKAYWGYDPEFLAACRAELTLTPDDVDPRRVTVAEFDGRVLGFAALAGEPPEVELAMLFVDPGHIGNGVGRALWTAAVDTAAALGAETMAIESDPQAEPFYLAMGATRIGEVESGSIPDRKLPLLVAQVDAAVRRPR
jgi:GNAT superfamily N-acetyltransferase